MLWFSPETFHQQSTLKETGMRKVVLTTGPQGSGKTTFCKEIIAHRPEIVLVERDAILIELFGTTHLDPYCGGHKIGEDVMWKKVAEVLSTEDDRIMILDHWAGYPRERSWAIRRLRDLGADSVDLWYFVTSEEVCLRQHEAREISIREKESGKPLSDWDIGSLRRCGKSNFRLFHSLPIEEYPGSAGFDSIKMINPCQLTFIPYADLLL